jgi:hypothetical protein
MPMNNYTEDQIEKVHNDPDYINSRKHGYSLEKFNASNSKNKKRVVTDKIIAHFLCTTPEEITKTYNDIIKHIRQLMKIDV